MSKRLRCRLGNSSGLFSFKKKGGGVLGRGRGRSSLGYGHSFPDLSLHSPMVLKPRQCLMVLVSDFYHHPLSQGCSLSGWGAAGLGGVKRE